MRTLSHSCLLILSFLAGGALAQPGYRASDLGPQVFASVAGAPGATMLAGVSGCDECTEMVALPFPFLWFGRAVSSVSVSANGQINMDARGAAECCAAVLIPEADGNDDAIFFAKQDLDPGLAGSVHAVTSGAPGAQTFTIEFQGVQFFMPVPAAIEVQVVLHESPAGRIDIIWGAGNIGTQSFSAGVEDAGGLTGSPAVTGAFFGAYGVATAWPAGRGCRFDPVCPGDCAAPTLLVPTVTGTAGARTASDVLSVDTGSCGFDSVSPSCTPAGANGADVLVQFIAPFTGSAVVDTCATASFDTLLVALDGGCGAPELDCNDDTCGDRAQILFPIVGGSTYTIVVESAGASTGTADLTVNLAEATCGSCASPLVWVPAVTGAPGGRSAMELFQVDTAACGGTDSYTPSCQPATGEDVVIEFVSPLDGVATVDTCGAGIDTILSVLDGHCGAAELACNDDDPICGGGASLVAFPVQRGLTYAVIVDRAGGGAFATDVTLRIDELTDCGTCASPQLVALAIVGQPGGRTASGVGTTDTGLCATDSYTFPPGCVAGGAPDSFDSILEFVAPFSGQATASTCDVATHDTLLAALRGACSGAQVFLACNDDACPGLRSQVSFAVLAGQTYTVVVDGFNGAVGAADVHIAVVETPCASPGTCADPVVLVPSVVGTPGTRASSDSLAVDTRICDLDNHAPGCAAGTGDDVVVQLVAPFDGEARATTCTMANFDTVLAALDGACGAAEIACNDDACGPVGAMLFSDIRFAIQSGRTYTVIVDGSGSGAATLTVDLFERTCLSAQCGDCNQNGLGPDILDALEAARINLGLVVPTTLQMVCCDVNRSGDVSITDALLIAQTAVSLPVTLACP